MTATVQSLALLIGSLALGLLQREIPAPAARSSATSTVPVPPEFGWNCWGRFDLDGHRAVMWRDFDASGTVASYVIQTLDSRENPHQASWTIDPRPDGPPATEPAAWNTGRSEADVLRDGPDYVHIDYPWNTEVVGPVHAYFWGDGTYAGVMQLFSARSVRRHTGKDGKMGGLSGGLSKGPIMQALYGSQAWAFKVVDATGKELASETFRPADLARSVTEYRQLRTEIESLEAQFRTDFQAKTRGSVSCAEHEDPSNTI